MSASQSQISTNGQDAQPNPPIFVLRIGLLYKYAHVYAPFPFILAQFQQPDMRLCQYGVTSACLIATLGFESFP